jgi:hypothetical protein
VGQGHHSFVDEKCGMGVDSGGMGSSRGRHDAEVVHGDMELGPSAQSKVVLSGLHQAGPPQSGREAPRLGGEERLVERTIVGANLDFEAGRLSDSIEVLTELCGNGPGRGCGKDSRQPDSVDGKGIGSPPGS